MTTNEITTTDLSAVRGFALMLATAAAAAGGFWLVQEHWHHVLGLSPYLLFLACPLMHLFMHGHGHTSQARVEDRHEEPPAG
jgi:hypothetical protein